MQAKRVGWLMVAWLCGAGVACGQDADLTIMVDGALLEHGGLIEVAATPAPSASAVPQTITLTDRYAQITLRYPAGASYNFRFRPVPDGATRPGVDLFQTQRLSIGSRTVEGPDGPLDMDTQSIRVLPFAEYAADPVQQTIAAWGETEGFAAPPPANEWGARALPQVFDTIGNRRVVGMICADQGSVSVCTPDPKDALLIEALWWRAIAEGRLGKLHDIALTTCYDSGGLFKRPERCERIAGDGWPAFVSAD